MRASEVPLDDRDRSRPAQTAGHGADPPAVVPGPQTTGGVRPAVTGGDGVERHHGRTTGPDGGAGVAPGDELHPVDPVRVQQPQCLRAAGDRGCGSTSCPTP